MRSTWRSARRDADVPDVPGAGCPGAGCPGARCPGCSRGAGAGLRRAARGRSLELQRQPGQLPAELAVGLDLRGRGRRDLLGTVQLAIVHRDGHAQGGDPRKLGFGLGRYPDVQIQRGPTQDVVIVADEQLYRRVPHRGHQLPALGGRDLAGSPDRRGDGLADSLASSVPSSSASAATSIRARISVVGVPSTVAPPTTCGSLSHFSGLRDSPGSDVEPAAYDDCRPFLSSAICAAGGRYQLPPTTRSHAG